LAVINMRSQGGMSVAMPPPDADEDDARRRPQPNML
jgi:hypothetical protein